MIRSYALPKGPSRLGLVPSGFKLSQDLMPDVNIKVGLGNVPKAVGFFAGSGLSFVAVGFLPKELRLLGVFSGIALAAGGVISLIRKPSENGGAPGATTGTQEIPDVVPRSSAPMPERSAVEDLTGQILSPTEASTVHPTGWWTKTFPVRVLIGNPTDKTVTIDFQVNAIVTALRDPSGSEGPTVHQTVTFRQTIGPRKSEIFTPSFKATIEAGFGGIAVFGAYKASVLVWRVVPGESPYLLDSVRFNVEY